MLDNIFAKRGIASFAVEPGATVPLRFSDPVAEHLATRRAAGLFDFSFMGHFEVSGAAARESLERLQTRGLARLAPGRLYYTLLLRGDGTVLIDATIWCLGPERYWLFTGRRSDFEYIAAAVHGSGAEARDLSGVHGVLAVQGPSARHVLERQLGVGALNGLEYFAFAAARLVGAPIVIGRVGYSGELGYEILVPGDVGPALWDLLAGDAELRECGFEAANSLRIESGLILFANELVRPVDPFELGLERLLSFDGRDFVGAAALRPRRWREPVRRLVGMEMLADAPGAIARLHDLPRAEVTSRAFSPVFGRELALGFAPAEAALAGALVSIGGCERARVCRLPFYDPARALPRGLPR